MGAFASFFLGGFECSCHVRRDGRRLDLLASTGHDRHAAADYALLAEHGIRAVRDGVRWPAIEARPGARDWSSVLPMAAAAARTGTEVIWDLCHYGVPDGLDVFSAAFPDRFADFAREAALRLAEIGRAPPWLCPVNEISFWAWAGGEVGRFGPFATGRGDELKRQLARAAIAATAAVREAIPGSRFICAEPAIHVDPGAAHDLGPVKGAAHHREAQFTAVDLLTGRREPGLGGSPDHLDVLGINFYPDNQWYYGGSTIPLGHHAYRPLSRLLAEWWERHRRPILLAETGAEGSARASWLHYVCGELEAVAGAGIPVAGVCLYPVLEYAGWENDRHCATGLLSAPDAAGRRRVHAPLAAELRRWRERFEAPEPRRLDEAA